MPGPRTSPRRLRVLAGLVGAVFLAGCQLPSVAGQLPPDTTDYPAQPPTDTLTGPVPVTRVVDGDTFWFQGAKYRIADIDTPETHGPRCPAEAALGARATRRLQSLMNAGAFSLEQGDRDTDRYGRSLRIVTRSGESIGAILVAEGLARDWDGARHPWC